MHVIGHHIGPARQHVLDRVRGTVDQAADLVQNAMGHPLVDVDVIVTDTYFARQIAGECDDEHRAYGYTAYTPNRILAIVNAQACGRDLGEVDRTTVHELVHAVQMSRPGARDGFLGLAWGEVDRLQGPALSLYRTRWNANEAEAQLMEYLALRLRAVGPVGAAVGSGLTDEFVREFHKARTGAPA